MERKPAASNAYSTGVTIAAMPPSSSSAAAAALQVSQGHGRRRRDVAPASGVAERTIMMALPLSEVSMDMDVDVLPVALPASQGLPINLNAAASRQVAVATPEQEHYVLAMQMEYRPHHYLPDLVWAPNAQPMPPPPPPPPPAVAAVARSSGAVLHCERVNPAHEDLVRLSIGPPCSVDLDLNL